MISKLSPQDYLKIEVLNNLIDHIEAFQKGLDDDDEAKSLAELTAIIKIMKNPTVIENLDGVRDKIATPF